jgi:hypothetical protein
MECHGAKAKPLKFTLISRVQKCHLGNFVAFAARRSCLPQGEASLFASRLFIPSQTEFGHYKIASVGWVAASL